MVQRWGAWSPRAAAWGTVKWTAIVVRALLFSIVLLRLAMYYSIDSGQRGGKTTPASYCPKLEALRSLRHEKRAWNLFGKWIPNKPVLRPCYATGRYKVRKTAVQQKTSSVRMRVTKGCFVGGRRRHRFRNPTAGQRTWFYTNSTLDRLVGLRFQIWKKKYALLLAI